MDLLWSVKADRIGLLFTQDHYGTRSGTDPKLDLLGPAFLQIHFGSI